jgi:hypothetical protein
MFWNTQRRTLWLAEHFVEANSFELKKKISSSIFNYFCIIKFSIYSEQKFQYSFPIPVRTLPFPLWDAAGKENVID